MAHCCGQGEPLENLGVGCCVLVAVAGFLGLYFGVPVLDPVDSEVHHVVVVVLEGYLGVLGTEAGAQGAQEVGHVLWTQEQHFPPLL